MTHKMDAVQKSLMGIPQEQIDEILRQAWEEAATEAKAILKQRMIHAILEQAASNPLNGVQVARLPGFLTNQLEVPPTPPAIGTGVVQASARPLQSAKRDLPEEPLNPAIPAAPAAKDQESDQATSQVMAEIDEIRRKIDENEQALKGIKAPQKPPVQTDPTPRIVPPPVGELDGEGFYVYGVTRTGQFSSESCPGIDPAYSILGLPYQNIQAIVSKVELSEFGEAELKANLNDPDWLESKVRAHQVVLETFCNAGVLVPMRFCTIYLSTGRIEDMLAEYYPRFIEALDYLTGKQEMGVKVYCDQQRLALIVAETSEIILARKSVVGSKSSGLAYFAKKKLEEETATEAERLNLAYTQASHNRLAACAEKSFILPMQSKEVTGLDEEMTLNAAYLVAEEKMSAFRIELENLENEYGPSGFSYVLTGPWPPFNFVSIGSEETAPA